MWVVECRRPALEALGVGQYVEEEYSRVERRGEGCGEHSWTEAVDVVRGRSIKGRDGRERTGSRGHPAGWVVVEKVKN